MQCITRFAVFLGAALIAAGVAGGCSSAPRTASSAGDGPPPEGYETWEDYWQAKDREYEDFERDRRGFKLTRPRVPGGPG